MVTDIAMLFWSTFLYFEAAFTYGFCTFCTTKLQILQHMQARKGLKKVHQNSRIRPGLPDTPMVVRTMGSENGYFQSVGGYGVRGTFGAGAMRGGPGWDAWGGDAGRAHVRHGACGCRWTARR